ncbi:uncharacterized protein LOC131262126 isoform X2 [Anopheles coustani]|uniref:uncharacterized protein LOC131262126 isoform X2 n=1 Tax=Anopheles coustani TaxID=139045 RepID=UPI00265898B9|nr:uncharacterized protein LOC131262126 isoform X2 [Anopheles coustani]
MSGTKCRLCLCSVDKQTGLFCSVKDETFSGMLKTVFSFPVTSVHTVANKTYNMPALVCLLCATSIRNFFDFSQKVAAVQKKLEKETLNNDDSMSISELLQLIKTEPVLEEDVIERNDNESLDMSVDIEPISRPTNQKQSCDLPYLRSGQSGQNQDWTVDRTDKFINCVDKNEVVKSIVDVERRVNYVATRLEQVLRKSLDPRHRIEQYESFDFKMVTNKEECEAFNEQLSEKAYMDKIINMIQGKVKSNDGRKRMYIAFDLFFSRAFVAECNWTGRNSLNKNLPGKIAFISFQHFVKLFQLIGTTNRTFMTEDEVIKFFKLKLHNAKQRMNLKGLRKAYYCKPHKKNKINKADNTSD